MKKCSTCRYRAAKTDDNGCDFYLITNKRRGCPVDNCTEYIKGEKIMLKTNMKSSIISGKLHKE